MITELNESDLLERASNGDRVAFSKLYSAYLSNLYRFIFSLCNTKETSEEVIQEVFMKLWEDKETLKSIISFKSYLYKCAKNILLNQLKKQKTQLKQFSVLEKSIHSCPIESDEQLVYDEYYQISQLAINQLPEKRREIFRLRLDDDLSLDEIAVKLSISKSVVKKQLYAGITFVRRQLAKHGEFYIWLFFICYRLIK